MLWTPSGNIVNDGLVLYLDAGTKGSYPGTGTTWTDLAGTNDGTFLNNASYTSDRSGGISLDGTDDAVLFGNVLNSTIAGVDKKFTFSAWIKTGNTIPGTIFSKIGDSSHNENNRQFAFRILNIGGVNRFEVLAFFSLGGSSTPYRGYYAAETTILANTIYNLTLAYDGAIDAAGRFGLYINGVSQTASLSFTNGSWGNIQSGTAQAVIGGAYGISGPLVGDWQGTVYQLQVYNRLLSAAEINQNFQVTRKRFGI